MLFTNFVILHFDTYVTQRSLKPCVTIQLCVGNQTFSRSFARNFVNVPFLTSSVPDLKLDFLSICKSNKNKNNNGQNNSTTYD